MSDIPSIEALIVSFNTKEELRGTLASLMHHPPSAQTAKVGISVLDNGSADGSPEMVAHEFPEVTLIRSDENLGFGRANNQLARQSAADYLLLLNSDVILTADIVTPLLRALERDPRLIAVGPRLVHPDGRVQYSAQRLPTLSYEFARVLRGRRLGRAIAPMFNSKARVDTVHEFTLTDRQMDYQTEFLWATCWLVRRADVVAHGLFDESFPMYDEDLDFCRRAQSRGRTLRYVAGAEMVHLGGASSKTSHAKHRLMSDARRRYYRRHHGMLAAGVYATGVPVVENVAALVDAIPRPRPRRRMRSPAGR